MRGLGTYLRATAAGLVLIASAPGAFWLAPAFAADAPVNLRFSFWIPPAHPLIKATQAWADDIAKQSGGALKVTIYPSQQLGKAFDHYDMARDGIVDIAYVNPGYQPGRFPVIAVGEIPFTFGDARKGTQALDTWYRAYAGKEMKDTHFCLAFIHDPGTLHTKKKVIWPADLKGLKVRPAQGVIGQLVTELGGTNVQASAPEAREVLARGVADAITFPWGSLYLFGIDKVVKYHIDAPLYTTVFTYNVNKDKYNSLSPAQRAVLDAHCTTQWAVKLAGVWGDFEAAGRERARADPSHHLFKLTPEQLAAWHAAIEPLKVKWAAAVAKVGVDPKDARAKLDEEIAKDGARAVSFMDRIIAGIEWTAAAFIGIVALDVFVSVTLRYAFGVSIPDSYDFGRMLLGILIFWGIAATSYRGSHITVDLLWSACSDRGKRAIDIFATVVLLFVVAVHSWMLLDKVYSTYLDHVLTYDLHWPTWPFFAVAWAGDVAAVVLIAVRAWNFVAGRGAP